MSINLSSIISACFSITSVLLAKLQVCAQTQQFRGGPQAAASHSAARHQRHQTFNYNHPLTDVRQDDPKGTIRKTATCSTGGPALAALNRAPMIGLNTALAEPSTVSESRFIGIKTYPPEDARYVIR